MTVAELLDRLERVHRSGDGWTARCPAHEDRRPSLSVSEGDDGRLLLKCHVGCSTEAILAALGVELRDLFPEQRGGNGWRRIVARYPYVDEQGGLLFEAVRFEPKGFAQRRPDGAGGWVWNLRGVRRVLYRLQAVLEAVAAGVAIYVCEGEKDAQALERLGLVATTCAMGAGKWRDEYAAQLACACRVVVLPDDDEEGRGHAEQVARSLAGAGVADVRVVQLWPLGDSKHDVADYVAFAHSDEELNQARTLLEQIVERVPPWSESEPPAHVPPDVAIVTEPGTWLERGSDLLSEPDPGPTPFLVDPLIVDQGIAAIYGKEKTGKTWLVLEFAAAIATGRQALGSFDVAQAGPVIVVLEESGRAALWRRLDMLRRGRAQEVDEFADLHVAANRRVSRSTTWTRSGANG